MPLRTTELSPSLNVRMLLLLLPFSAVGDEPLELAVGESDVETGRRWNGVEGEDMALEMLFRVG